MHGLPARIHNHILQVLPRHAIKRCYGVQATTEMGFGMPAETLHQSDKDDNSTMTMTATMTMAMAIAARCCC